MMYCEKKGCLDMREILSIFVDCHPAQVEPLKDRAAHLLGSIRSLDGINALGVTIDQVAQGFRELAEAYHEREELINETGN